MMDLWFLPEGKSTLPRPFQGRLHKHSCDSIVVNWFKNDTVLKIKACEIFKRQSTYLGRSKPGSTLS